MEEENVLQEVWICRSEPPEIGGDGEFIAFAEMDEDSITRAAKYHSSFAFRNQEEIQQSCEDLIRQALKDGCTDFSVSVFEEYPKLHIGKFTIDSEWNSKEGKMTAVSSEQETYPLQRGDEIYAIVDEFGEVHGVYSTEQEYCSWSTIQ